MEILLQIGELRTCKVLDFGCGTGHLLTLLKSKLNFHGEYVGYDISPEMITIARQKFPDIKFEQRNILTDGIPETFDYIFASGVFNNQLTDNWGWMTTLLTKLFSHTRIGVAFNALSTYVDYYESNLFYVSPEEVFRFCKSELSPCVTIRHDYQLKPGVIPFEFSVYVYRCDRVI
ncbi:hypothetical protein DO97_04900 [Neosynechococcus sphagnicola sy1]|uniref:Methyltransferase domain-containing protein n=2 Tax=Neosynechococcus TaxID=1501143 RepID=A0A098TPP9_9CYAN|nr:hypothetical protein DO97_04900 [Neosynechococcus sphagnicola sy1]